jgi:hypothetical protein
MVQLACGGSTSDTPSVNGLNRDSGENTIEQSSDTESSPLPVPKGLFSYEIFNDAVLDAQGGVENEITLNWWARLGGDYNDDGTVSGNDLFPLTVNFGKSVDEDPSFESIDGNGDGRLNGLDVFAISSNFLSRIEGFHVDLTWDSGSERLTSQPIEYQGRDMTYTYTFQPEPDQMDGLWVRVLAYDDYEAVPVDVSEPLYPPQPQPRDAFSLNLPNLNTNQWDSAAGRGGEIRIGWLSLDGSLNFSVGGPQGIEGTWNLGGSVDNPYYWPQLSSNQNDSLQVSYFVPDGLLATVVLAEYDGSGWNTAAVHENVVSAPAFDTADDGTAGFLYLENGGDDGMMLFGEGGIEGFSDSPVAENVRATNGLDLVMDGDDVHAVWLNGWDVQVNYSHRTGGSFDFETELIDEANVARSSLVLENGVPHLYYAVWDGGTQDLKHAWRVGDNLWETEILRDNTGFPLERVDALVDDSGQLLLASSLFVYLGPDELNTTCDRNLDMDFWNHAEFSPERTGAWKLLEGDFGGYVPVVTYSRQDTEDTSLNGLEVIFPSFDCLN